jgi:hypothetical protein
VTAQTLVNELELPYIDTTGFVDRDQLRNAVTEVAKTHWLARTPLGYMVTHHEDVTAVLRERRWHQLARLLAELNGLKKK